MEEIWKDIYEYDGVNYQGKYQVSNYGNIRSNDYIIHSTRKQTYLKEGRNIKPFYSCKYLRTKLCINGKSHSKTIHRLVATYFVPNSDPDFLTEVNHKDENRLNNRADNLEWCSRKYNMNYYFERHPEARKIKNEFIDSNSSCSSVHNHCIVCGKEIGLKTKTGMCITCFNKTRPPEKRYSNRKVQRPSREVLKDEIRHSTFKALSQKYGVSDSSIKKWCKAYSLPYKAFEIRKYTDEEWMEK